MQAWDWYLEVRFGPLPVILQIAVCIMFLGEHVGITKDRGGIWTMILTIIVIALEI